jgi:Zinc knuckle
MMKKKLPKEPKDPFAIDIDAIRAGTMDKDKKDRLQKEGRCFFCEKQGHLSRQCPKKQGGTKLVMPATPKPQVRTTKSVEEDETTQVGDDEEPLTQLRTLQAKMGKGAFMGVLDEIVTFSFFFSIYTTPSSGIELCYRSHEGLGSFRTVRKPLWDFPLSSIFVVWEHHFLISHTSASFPCFATFRSISLV